MSHLSPAPGTPQTPYKAYASTALTLVVAFALIWIADDGAFTSKEMASAAVQSLIGAGLVGGTTFAVKNKAKVIRPEGGYTDLVRLLVVVILVIVLIWVVLALL